MYIYDGGDFYSTPKGYLTRLCKSVHGNQAAPFSDEHDQYNL